MSSSIDKKLMTSVVVLFLLLSFQATLFADSMDLVGSLTEKLGISSEQATGGAGAVFSYAKDNLEADDFATVAKGVPNMDGLLAAAPEADSGSALGKVGGMLGGKDSKLGSLASLTSSFDSLGIDPDMVSQFLPIVYDYVGGASGEKAMGLLKGLF